MKKKKLAIIADDYTGANDTGVQFSKKELRTIVVSNLEFMNQSLQKADVLVIDTESRFDTAEEAYKKVYQASRFLKENKVNYVYKKLDSTFRGNIGAEISAAMDALEINLAVMAPAFPATGRITLDGKVYLNGVLLEDTEIAKDPKTPVKSSSIADILRMQTDKRVTAIPLDEIAKGVDALIKRIEELGRQGEQILILDSDKKRDLEVIAKAINQINQSVLIVGSAGLAEYLPDALSLKMDEENRRILVIAGSVSDVTRKQVNFAAANDDGIQIIDVTVQEIFRMADAEKEIERIMSLACAAFTRGQDVIIRTAKERALIQIALEAGIAAGFQATEVSERIALFLGEVTKRILSGVKIGGLMLTGGDVAIKVADKLSSQGILIENEILPGIPYGYFIHDHLNSFPVATKAGAFGEEEAIKITMDFLRQRR